MNDSWASYKNGESEVTEFIKWLGGTKDDWKERTDMKWVIQLGQIKFIYFPMSEKLVIYGETKQLRVTVNKFITFIQAKQNTKGEDVDRNLLTRRW